MASVYWERLIRRVLELSTANDWDTAVTEWEIADCEEDDTLSESCVCGKEHLYYLFTIENVVNGNTLFPIGSSCIKNLVEKIWMTKWQFEKRCSNCIMQWKITSLFLFLQSFFRERF